MEKPQTETENKDEKVNVRHTITAEETFTLAKDVFDLRCFIKNVYSNRAVIARRLNILTLSVSAVFTVLYAAYVLFTAFTKKLNLQYELTLYVMLGVYAALFAALIITTLCGGRAKTKNVLKIKRTLSFFKIMVRLTSIAISVTAIVFSMSGGEFAPSVVAVDILIIVFSVITLILQIFPLLFGGLAKLARWLLAPVKIKFRFGKVILEWYELTVSGTATGAAKKVASKYYEEIGTLIDNYLVPALGRKYINSIKPAALINVVNRAQENDKRVLEGILKNVFAYATECGYVTFDPCRDLNFEGNIEEEEKPPKKTFRDRLLNIGKKVGKSMLDKYISDSVNTDKK